MKEFNVNDIIDYDTQFDKAFIEPLNLIIERIGWKVDKSYGTQLSLEDFFWMILNREDSIYAANIFVSYFSIFSN